MVCDWEIFSICLVKAGSSTPSIFGFSEFVAALALLVIVYTITDVRYKFRVATAPVNLPLITFPIIALIGLGTLISELWVAESWPTFTWNLSQSLWQSIFAMAFLVVVLLWLWYAFISPPKFSRWNHNRFYNVVYSYVVQSKRDEIKMLSDELHVHLPKIVAQANKIHGNDVESAESEVQKTAYELIFLLSNSNFCDALAIHSPHSALAFFDALNNEKCIYANCFNIITSLISSSFISNKSSLIYHEGDSHASGLLGHQKSLSKAMFGHYKTFSQIRGDTVLDLDYETSNRLDGIQFKKYCDLVLLSFESFVKEKRWLMHSAELYRAIGQVKHSVLGLTSINGRDDLYIHEEFVRFKQAVQFAQRLVEILDKQDKIPAVGVLRKRGDRNNEDFYDHIASLYFELIHISCYVNKPMMTCWEVQHNTVWVSLFNSYTEPGKAKKIVLHKVRRALYDSIKEFETFPNYQASRILGFCINIFFTITKGEGLALRKVVKTWVESNFSKLHADNPKLADAALMEGVEYSPVKKSIVRVYRASMGRPPKKKYWRLR
jgi:hypothetical protein